MPYLLAATLTGFCSASPGTIRATGHTGTKINFYKADPIRGTVIDAVTGKPLSGASISIKGGSQQTLTSAEGRFTITGATNTAVLVITYVGYTTQEINASSTTVVSVSMIPASADLAQVVVVGYGTQNKRDVTGSVKSLRADAFNKGIINTPSELLQGKVAGVNVTSASGEPGGNTQITVRGPGGIRTGSTPLFVVDGLPLDNSGTGGAGDPLTFINPADIESMDVLKDASATAIYGTRGANGVILITTKRGKAGTSTLNFTTSLGVSKVAHLLPVLTADQFRVEVPKLGGALDDLKGSTDWQKEAFRTATTQNYNLNLSGGADRLSYYASFGAQMQQGIMKKNSLDRYSGRFNATQRFWDDRLIIDANLNVTNTKNNRPPYSNILGDAIGNNPTYPAYDANGNPAIYQNINNPLIYLNLDRDITTINRVLASISPSLRLVKGLVYKVNFGVDVSNATRDVEALPNAVPLRDGRLDTYYTNNRNTLIENYLTYTLKTGKHDISALAGHSYQKIYLQGRNYSINKFPVNSIDPFYNPGVGTELTLANNRPGGYAAINELQSVFGRATYQYNNKYLLTANFRADGSSKFGSNNRYGYFPSFSLGWKISEEDFMKNSSVSNLKLRAGYGLTGNQEIPNKITQATTTSTVTSTTSYPLLPTGPYPSGTIYGRVPNPDIQWEVSKQANVGLDFGFLNGSLTGTVDVFRKVTSNILLLSIPADPVQSAPNVWLNVPDMTITNKGVEFEMDYRHKSATGITYNAGGNVTYMKNIVEHSPYTVIPSGSASGSGLTSATVNGYINNQPIGTFFLKQWTGFDANGISTYLDTDKDGIVTDKDRVSSGTALPNLIYSFYGGASFKGFDLNANFNGVSGNKIYDNTANASFYKLKLSKNVNTTAEAIADPKESVNNSAPVSTRYLKDGAYLRLNSMVLGYTFNTASMGVSKYISGIRLSVTAQNLFVSTKYDGYDPEVNTDRQVNGVLSYGIDYLSYPKARSVIFGLNVSF
ncbi:MAG: SusC/RagA family TonB-linked outer membrane protein [Chitinophagaceae bacterium]